MAIIVARRHHMAGVPGAQGCGRFRFKNGEVHYSKYYGGSSIQDINVHLILFPYNDGNESGVIDYSGDNVKYNVNYDGSVHASSLFIPFNPEWYNLNDTFMDLMVDFQNETFVREEY